MTKRKALFVGSIFTVITCVAVLSGQDASVSLPVAVPALLFMGFWFYKVKRDQNIIKAAEQERLEAAQVPLPPPAITSPGSKGIFLPKALNNPSRTPKEF